MHINDGVLALSDSLRFMSIYRPINVDESYDKSQTLTPTTI